MSIDAARRSPAEDRIRGLVFVGVMVAVMWVVEVVDVATGGDLDRDGIVPRAVDGLDGVVCAPFLHGSWSHLRGNTIPFVVLGALIALSGLARIALVTAVVAARLLAPRAAKRRDPAADAMGRLSRV